MKSGFLHALILHVLTQIEIERASEEEEEEEDMEEEEEDEDEDEKIVENEGDEERGEGGGGVGTKKPLVPVSVPVPVPTPLHVLVPPTSPSAPCQSLYPDNDSTITEPDTFDYLSHSKTSEPSKLARLLLQFFRGGAGLEGDFCYNWPIPGKPTHVLNADEIKEFATCCARAYQIMAYSGSWTEILDHCSDNEEVSYSIRLPDGVSKKMMSCYESRAMKLRSISNVR